MEQQIITETAKNRGISRDAVIREYYEFVLLKLLFESPIGNSIAFKGGTALRIFYALPRYSDDLDFTMVRKFDFDKFSLAMTGIVSGFGNMKITDVWNKQFTYICEIRITENWMKMPFSIKIEVSKRKDKPARKTELKLAVSSDFGINVLGNVYDINSLYLDKKAAIAGRDEPKDFFDLWYICSLLKVPFEPGKIPDKKRYRQVLFKYVPLAYKKVLEQIL